MELNYINIHSKEIREIYKKMVDLGADIVVGSQSHCIQAMEKYLNKYIYYSTGDLLFDHFHEYTKSDFISDISHSKKFSIKAGLFSYPV